ncbi:CRISPR-associated protein Csn2-St [Streptococcus sp. H49]|uniref:CRISPR-associated protein Csn2-St n=1 Tax=Streptococcus huangxiaojuni TaxID=3237239 RepID=UPI0034A3A7F7
MKWHFSHPYKDNLDINFGQFTQIVGQNQQLKYYVWQLLIWYFTGKKYREEDLTLFNQTEPEIFNDRGILKRNEFKIISISGIQDLLEQMSYKKGTVSFDFMKQKLTGVDIMADIDEINNCLDEISNKINTRLDLSLQDISYHIESVDFNPEQLLLKSFAPFFKFQEQNISFEFVDNEEKILFFLEMLKERLKVMPSKTLLILKNMDDYLTYSSFILACRKLEELCTEFPYFYVMIFPSNEGYLYSRQWNIEYINILSDYIEHYYEFEFLFERFIQQYPSNQVLNEEEFLDSIRKISGYLFSKEIEYVSLSTKDLITIKILNRLYQYDKNLNYHVSSPNPLEIKFLQSEN